MTPTAAALLARVRAAGANVEAHGDKITWCAPAHLPADLLDELRRHKHEVMQALCPLSVATVAELRAAIEILTRPDIRGCSRCSGRRTPR